MVMWFSLSFAACLCVYIANNLDPIELLVCRYDQAKLRDNLLNCLKDGKLEPFPSQMMRARRPIRNENVGIYCTCRLPDNGEERMAMCSKCGEWFHETCQKIPKTVFKQDRQKWFCTSCVATCINTVTQGFCIH